MYPRPRKIYLPKIKMKVEILTRYQIRNLLSEEFDKKLKIIFNSLERMRIKILRIEEELKVRC